MMKLQSPYRKAFLAPDVPLEERKAEFGSVLREIKKTSASDIAERTLQILRYLWRHGLVIVLLLLPALLLIFMDQGSDLIKNLLHPATQGFSGQYFMATIWFFAAVVLSSYAIWAIPQFFLDHENKEQKIIEAQGRGKGELLKSQSSNFLRIAGVAPFAIYGLAFIVGARITHFNPVSYTLANLLVALVIAGVFLLWIYPLGRFKSLLYLLLGSLIGLPLLTTRAFAYFQENIEIAYAVLGNSLFFLMLLMFGIYLRWELKFMEVEGTDEEARLSRKGKGLYRIVGVVTAAKLLVLVFWPNTLHMSTIPVLVFLMAAYILFINHLSYRFKVMKPKGKIGFILGLIVLGIWGASIPSHTHYVYLTPARDVPARPTLEAYTDQWFMDRMPDIDGDTSQPYVLYLVAGEGGGSRAGYWTTRMLSLLDSVSDFQFSERVFALSTVSGSSVGAASWVKWLQYAQDLNYSVAQQQRMAPSLAFNVFQANFVTGSIINLFVTDIITAFLPMRRRSGRNVRLQREEHTAFVHALDGVPLTIKDTYRRLYDGEPEITFEGNTLRNYHFLPIQAMYVDAVGTPLTHLPLTFFNTTQMSTGRKGILSPVRLPSDFSDLFIDVIDSMETCQPHLRNRTIAFGTANNLSELFPVFSAFSYIDGIGNFMDGGGYENKGLSTTMEIYDYLTAYLARQDWGGKVRIVVLALENGSPGNGRTRMNEIKPRQQLVSMVSQASAQPFKSTTEKARQRIVRLLPEEDCLFISLSDYTPRRMDRRLNEELSESLPLARDLSDYSLRVMEAASYKALDDTWHRLLQRDPQWRMAPHE